MLPPSDINYAPIGSPTGVNPNQFNPLFQRQQTGQGPTGTGGAAPAGMSGGMTGTMPMNVQHPTAPPMQAHPMQAAPAQNPAQGLQQFGQGMQSLNKMFNPQGQQPNPSQAQTAASGVNKPNMPLQGNPTIGQSVDPSLNPNAQASAQGLQGPVTTPDSSPAMGGGLLGNGFDSSLMGGALDPNAMTGMDLNMVDPSSVGGDLGGDLGGGLLGFF